MLIFVTHVYFSSQFTKKYVYDRNSIMRVPDSFYDPDLFDYSLEIAPRVEAWLGMYIGVKELNDGHPVLNFAGNHLNLSLKPSV